ncbi:MFS general substrate transporter [Patellaria atrata CBS 101060]|uniref:MFS general substrate transporter n=1 Tax=Patellaria atrata CBS 101060 TaxID=1346257 RepID=A0A9P4SC23_9PEZI|nr:MFS general substrate transporter [Patellaria atrata CBS 101060]
MRLQALNELDRTEGTVQLRQQADNFSKLVLIPHPSTDDPNDPLRWPVWKKHVAFGSVCAFTFLTNFGIGGMAPAFFILSQEFGKSMTQTSDLLLWPILVLGVFNFVWVPLANCLGKRPVFVFSSLILCIAYIWGAEASNFRSLLWSSILAAFAGSSTETLGAAIVNDVYFLHERGAKMGIYMNSISGGNTVGPLICGFIVEDLGWRWHKRLAVILSGINFLAILFFVPETQYARDVSKSLEPTASDTSLPALYNAETETKQNSPVDAREILPSSISIPKKSYLQELSLWSGVAKDTNILKTFVRPLPMIVYPAVIFAFLGYAVSLAWVVAVNILNSFVLQAPPYSWRPSINGLINIPGLIGNLLGAYAGGWLVDVYSDYRTRRNNGTFVPETRLVLLMLPILIVPAGCLLFGYGVENTMHWTTMFFGYGMISFGLTAVPTATLTYVSDCYFPVAPDALLLVNGLKNIVAFGFLHGVVPWVTNVGYIDCFGTQAGVYTAVIILAIPLYMFGANIRHTTASWRIIL